MPSLVLEKKGELNIRDIELPEDLGPHDVKVRMHTVGICASDVHYYTEGFIGPFVVKAPMVMGHEGSGIVESVGSGVEHLKAGDRVCMEPGIPDPNSKAAKLGIYNLDPGVKFWATPPVHGCLTETVIHPAAYTYKLPENVSFAEGAMVEPLAVGMQAAKKARIQPGDLALVFGAGPIGMVTSLAALAGGCSRVVICDVLDEKLDLARKLDPAITGVNVKKGKAADVVGDLSGGWGADIVFECTGSEHVAPQIFDPLRPGGRVVYVGMPCKPISFDIVVAQTKEATIETIFRYANVYDRAVALLASGKINVKPLLTDRYSFEDSIRAFDEAVKGGRPASVKSQIVLGKGS